ncbi:MAG: PorP/SprF family type IX secretion system membrane protein [Cyclobacteriaceae bacterium]|nr:MAG: PorP/SprF family type IX secretion system membrane protein [Cyclobacteriaceae bacterium]
MYRISRFYFLCVWLALLTGEVFSQDAANFTQFFINPFSYNPSYAGTDGRAALFVGYRKQWANIQGGPTIANLSLHGQTTKAGLNFGLNVINDTRGVLNTSGLSVAFGYSASLSDQVSLRFGVSVGGAWNMVNLEEIEDASDPALAELLDQNAFLLGNAGISLHAKTFHLGVSLPSIFSPSYVSVDPFSFKEVKPFQSVIVSASNRFYFGGDKHIFEPYVLYRINTGLPSQYEVAGVVHLNHVIWVGGSYKQDFGISALGGVKINHTILIGGSYSLKNTGINELNSPTYEVQMSYLLGQRKRNVPHYSFVDAEKEKPKKRKSASELIAERRKEQEAEQKKRQEELAKKQREEQLAKEKAAKEREAQLRAAREAEQKQKEAEVLAAKQAEQRQKEAEAQAARQAELNKQQAQQQAVQTQPQPQQPQQQQTQPVVVQPQPQQRQPVVVQQPQQTQPQPVTPVEPPLEDHSHDGGARFRSQLYVPVYVSDEENERTLRLEEHAADPDEHHGEDPDFHPNAERHEFVKRGGHQDEMDTGDFVVVGTFRSKENAIHFSEGLVKLGFTADYGHLTEKEMWYVYVAQTNDINTARTERDKYRKMKIFRDAWLLTVHH